MFKTFCVFFVLNVLLYCGLWMWIAVQDGSSTDYSRLLETDKYSWMLTFYTCVNLSFITLLMIRLIIDLRRKLQAVFYVAQISS